MEIIPSGPNYILIGFLLILVLVFILLMVKSKSRIARVEVTLSAWGLLFFGFGLNRADNVAKEHELLLSQSLYASERETIAGPGPDITTIALYTFAAICLVAVIIMEIKGYRKKAI